jgi:hypothetical protein
MESLNQSPLSTSLTARQTETPTGPCQCPPIDLPLAKETAAWVRIAPASSGLLTAKEAAGYLRMSERQLVDRADIPKVNIAGPGAKPQWRWRPSDLDTFVAARVAAPYIGPQRQRQAA